MSDTQWLQASTPIKSGGLGIQHAMFLALPAFLAFAVAMTDLLSAILSCGTQNIDKEVELAWSLWCSLTTPSPPMGPLQASQRAWDALAVARGPSNLS